jgi:predicted ATP-grasp superfamily ATP-dependent carboligase
MIGTLRRDRVTGHPGAPRREASGLPPVIVLGGGANALSVARSLGRLGVRVYAINEDSALVRHSRHCRWLGLGDAPEAWARFLLGPESEPLRGAVLLACSDDGIEIIAHHRDALSARFLLDESDPAAQLCMLNKYNSYCAARSAGVPTPRFWVARTREQVLALLDRLVFPLIVKPHLTHRFERRSGRKFVLVNDTQQLLDAHALLGAAGIETMLVEWIPGPDDRLCSYYTYLDSGGNPLFHFTKRIIRRYPAGLGNGCYHVTDWNPEVRDLALALFRHVGLRGLANAEFKRDQRDGRLKLIECNARFTAANGLVTRSGLDLAVFVYNRLVGRPQPLLETYARGMRLWDPVRDFEAFLELRRQGQITFWKWLASILHRQSFPYFEWSDPLPALVRMAKPFRARRRRNVAIDRTRRDTIRSCTDAQDPDHANTAPPSRGALSQNPVRGRIHADRPARDR